MSRYLWLDTYLWDVFACSTRYRSYIHSCFDVYCALTSNRLWVHALRVSYLYIASETQELTALVQHLFVSVSLHEQLLHTFGRNLLSSNPADTDACIGSDSEHVDVPANIGSHAGAGARTLWDVCWSKCTRHYDLASKSGLPPPLFQLHTNVQFIANPSDTSDVGFVSSTEGHTDFAVKNLTKCSLFVVPLLMVFTSSKLSTPSRGISSSTFAPTTEVNISAWNCRVLCSKGACLGVF